MLLFGHKKLNVFVINESKNKTKFHIFMLLYNKYKNQIKNKFINNI